MGVMAKPRKILTFSMQRYNGGIAIKRKYGSSTVTRFYVMFAEDEKDAARWEVIEGYGKTPGERATYAKDIFAKRHGV